MAYLNGRTRFTIIIERQGGTFRDFVWSRTSAEADRAGKAKWGEHARVSSQADDYGREPMADRLDC